MDNCLPEILRLTFETLAAPVAACLGTRWRVLNVRAWKTRPGAEVMGPNAWHRDGFPRFALKLMIYLTGANEEIGTTEIELEDGSRQTICGPEGTWLLFQNGDLRHRGIAPLKGERVLVEITLGPSLRFNASPVFAGLNSAYPYHPWARIKPVAERPQTPPPRSELVLRLNRGYPPVAVNLGGGPNFSEIGWLNLEEVASEANPVPFKFTPTCSFPLPDASVHTVYTSHALEHLETETVNRLLTEAHRVLTPNGRLVIKIPDFDRVLDCWKRKELDFFSDSLWGFNAVTYTWGSRGVPDNIESRVAMIFCGFWNDAYGDHFSWQVHQNAEAYHGPAVVSPDVLQDLLLNGTPAEISSRLREHVVASEASIHFNHQNAWSRLELQEVLAKFGFRVLSMDTPTVLTGCADIPDIAVMSTQSTYCLASKTVE